jgi:hypothetical protein
MGVKDICLPAVFFPASSMVYALTVPVVFLWTSLRSELEVVPDGL